MRQGHDETNTFVAAGKYDLRYFEANAQRRNLAKIVLHPDWKPHATNFDADIALATTEYAMYFTNLVQPICLPNFNAVLIHPLGTVVGWGRSEKTGDNKLDHDNLPKEIEVKAVTNEECFLHYDEFAKISSPRTFCAGWPGKNIGPCHGGFIFVLFLYLFYSLCCKFWKFSSFLQVTPVVDSTTKLVNAGSFRELCRRLLLIMDVATLASIRFIQIF